MKVFITGDTHIPIDIGKISNKKWKEARSLTSDDYLIVLGDFGLIWHNYLNSEELYWTKILCSKKYNILFIDGNHDNIPKLNELPKVELFGATAGQVSENIYHLRRGEVYTIGEKRFFTFGGAVSIDKAYRQEGISWWREEVASVAEMDYGLSNIEKHDNKVNFILSHTLPYSVVDKYLYSIKSHRFSDIEDPTEKYLDHVCSIVEFEHLYAGHWHDNWSDGKYHILYEDIIQL